MKNYTHIIVETIFRETTVKKVTDYENAANYVNSIKKDIKNFHFDGICAYGETANHDDWDLVIIPINKIEEATF